MSRSLMNNAAAKMMPAAAKPLGVAQLQCFDAELRDLLERVQNKLAPVLRDARQRRQPRR